MSDLFAISAEDRMTSDASVPTWGVTAKESRGWGEILCWVVIASVAFFGAYLSAKSAFVVVVYLFALMQLALGGTWRKAFYPGLIVGLLIAVVQLAFFWKIFSQGAVALWLVYAFWIGLFVAMARVCLRALPGWAGWVAVPFVWTGLEYFRSELYYLRFSWLSPGYAFAEGGWEPVLKGLGTYGVGFVLMGVACLGVAIWKGCGIRRVPADSRSARWGKKGKTPYVVSYNKPGEVVSCDKPGEISSVSCNEPGEVGSCDRSVSYKNRARAVAVLLVGAGLVYVAGWLVEGRSMGGLRNRVNVAGIQMEFPTEKEVLLRLDDLVRRHPETEMVVLSEYTFNEPVPEKVKEWCRKNGRYLVAGGKAPAGKSNFYNTAFVVAPNGKVVFEQGKTVPIQFFQDGLPAREQRVWDSPWGKLGICICYDLSYARVTDRLVRQGAEGLIVPTMDVAEWGERQHELHARVAPIRAAEYGIPVFRLASSGISQFVNAAGKVTAKTACFADGEILCGTLELRGAGRMPVDMWLGPLSTGVTVMLMGFVLVSGGLAKLKTRGTSEGTE